MLVKLVEDEEGRWRPSVNAFGEWTEVEGSGFATAAECEAAVKEFGEKNKMVFEEPFILIRYREPDCKNKQ